MASQTIDKLQVEIEASAKSLNTVFSQLQSNLSQLQKTINSIDTSKLTALSKSTNSVSINTSGMSKAEKDISNSVSKIQQSLAGLESYKNAALSGDSSSLTSFNRRVISIQSNIDVLREKFAQLGNTGVETTAFTNLKTQSDELQTKLDGLKAKMDDLLSGKTTISNQAFQQLSSEIATTEGELEAVNAQMTEMVANGTAVTDPFASYRDSLDQVQSQLNTTSEEVQNATANMNNSSPNIDTTAAKESLESLTSAIKDTVSNLWDLTKSGITAGIDGLKSSFSALSTVVSGVKTGVTTLGSAFSSGVSKILKYGFGIRSTYVLFRRLRSYVVDAFTELQNSGAYFETTNANVDALSNSLSTLKYQFGAAFEPIFNTVAPALQTLINYLVAVMNTISAFIAKLTGGSTYSKAVVATSEIADNTGSAASSAEDLNKQLQGFDELNNLSGDDDSGGGGSGSSSSDDSTITYVEESVESALSDFWNTLADYIEAGDWYMVGSTISDCLTDALNSINWNTVFSTVSNWGTNLATFMNGLITEDLFSAIGTTIGNSIKTALTFLNSFGTTFDWSNFGSSIAAGINAYVETNPLGLAVETFNTWANGILTTLSTAIDQTDWSQIATNIADAIGKFDASGIMGKLGTVANELANALYTLVSNKDTWSNLGTKIGEGINSFFSSMNTVDSKTGLSGWGALGSTITNGLTGFGDMLITALETTDWEAVGQGIADFISGIDWSKIIFTFGKLLDAIKEAIKGILKGAEIDAGDITITILSIGALVSSITAIKLAATLTKQVIEKMIEAKLATLIGTEGFSLAVSNIGKISATVGTVSIVITAAIVGWEIGKHAYETVSGENYPDWGEIWDTLFSPTTGGSGMEIARGIKLDLASDASITLDLAGTLAVVTGIPSVAAMTANVDTLKARVNQIRLEVDNSKTDSAMKFTNQVTFQGILGDAYDQMLKDSEEYGGDLFDAMPSGMAKKASEATTEDWKIPMVHKSVDDAIEDEFEINSPAKTMKKYGSAIVEGIRDGISENSTTDMFSGAISGLKSVIDSVLGLNGLSTYNVTVTATQGTPDSSLKSMGNSFSDKIKKKWTDTHADVDADLGGDLEDNGINTFSTWESVFSTFKSIWTGTSATFKAKTGGEISNINDLTSWQSLIEGLTGAWQSKDAKFSAGYGSGTSANVIDTMKSKIGELVGAWQSKKAEFTAGYGSGTNADKINTMKSVISGLTGTSGLWHSVDAKFTAGYGSGTTAQKLTDMNNAISPLVSNWKSPAQATFNATFNQSLETMQGYKDAITGIYDNWKGASADFTVNANVNTSNFGEIAQSLVNEINKRMSGTKTYKLTAQALGGVLTNGGWKSIPQYAGGTLNTGSLFFAGEKSGNPELVGHVNGRTEVLNKSQIAATMYSSITQAMRNFGSLATPSSFAVNSSGYTPYNGSANGRSNSDMLIMEQNRLLVEQNSLLQQIASKDNSINITDLFSAMQTENNNYISRTGNSAFF